MARAGGVVCDVPGHPQNYAHDCDGIGDWSPDGRRCPRCNARTIVNALGDEWCSYVSCDWSKDGEVHE